MAGKLKMGMVGGGQGAFIGAVHRIAAALDNDIELVCGAFSSTKEKSLLSGQALHLPSSRIYANYQEMMAQEALLPEAERMDFVSIVTPNHMHFPVAKEALQAGFHVICDKPMTLDVQQATELKHLVEQTQRVFALTHTYTGYPMVKEARHLVQSGALGKIRKVIAEYTQGWLTEPQDSDNKQASWRTNPETSGLSGCMGDIGSHAANLAEYVCGQKITEVNAELTAFVEGRLLDDDGMALIKLDGGAKGILHASQVACGEENNLTLRIYGELGGLEWQQQEPNSLYLKWLDKPQQILRTGGQHSSLAAQNTRIPMGHPEGYLEAFANIYNNFASAVKAHKQGKAYCPATHDYPGVEDGCHGMNLLHTLVHSSNSERKWVPVLTEKLK